MIRIWKLALAVALLGLVGLSCSDGPESLTQSTPNQSPLISALSIPLGSSLVSATLSVYVDEPGYSTVRVHRITNPWEEMVVTYDNFGNAFDASIIGTFVTDASGWSTVDVTSAVQDWMDGTYDNYGFLLEQGRTTYSRFQSSENSPSQPMLEICYTTPSGTECNVIQRGAFGTVADSYISDLNPTENAGASPHLYCGLRYNIEKMTLIRFDMEDSPPELAAIGDYVWLDTNEDGIQDGDETGVPGVWVRLYDCLGNELNSMQTDANGYYLFDNLVPADYHVGFTLPEGYTFSPQDQGANDAADSDADVVTGMTSCTTLEAGETDLTWDAGIFMIPFDGCTLTIGFWKTHGGFGPQADMVTALLPILLGDAGGTKTLDVNTGIIAHNVLLQNVYGHPDNGITKLYAQLLGAKLNIANGAAPHSVGNTIGKADEFLADYDWTDWDTLANNKKNKVLNWHLKLDEYNNGLIGPGHCD